MKSVYKIPHLLIMFLCFTFSKVHSQQSLLNSYHFNDFTDTKSAAMGFTAVSNPYSPMSYKENPANLTFDSDINLYGVGYGNDLIVSSSLMLGGIGIAFDYSQANQFGIILDGYSSNVSEADDFFTIALSKEMLKNFSVGTSVTIFPFYNSFSYKLNLGGLYKFDNLFNLHYLNNELLIGFSLNNIGPDLKTEFRQIYLPIYASIGATFRIESAQKSLFAYEFEFSMKYKNYLNPDDGYGIYYRDEHRYRDYWGIGFNLSLFNILSLRDGFYKNPIRSNFLHTAGFAIHFPPKFLKFSITLEYMRFWKPDYYLVRGNKNFAAMNFSYRLE